jgi:hypothetical protein
MTSAASQCPLSASNLGGNTDSLCLYVCCEPEPRCAAGGPSVRGFDLSSIGRVVRIDGDGDRTAAAVTLPSGLEWQDGALYASAWSIAGFLGLEGRSEVVRIGADASTDISD